MMEYTLEEYQRRERFLAAVESSGIDPTKLHNDPGSVAKKRELWTLLYRGMTCEGSHTPLPVGECRAARVNAAFLAEFERSKRYVAEFPIARPLIAKTHELLDLEDLAVREAANLPLFGQPKLDKARADISDYFGGLTAEQRKIVKGAFGRRVAQYLSSSGMVKAQV